MAFLCADNTVTQRPNMTLLCVATQTPNMTFFVVDITATQRPNIFLVVDNSLRLN
jgi:hypothetical protein